MKSLKNKRTIILSVVLLGLLIIAYKTMFVSSEQSLTIDENIAASQKVEAILQKVQNIDFDTSVTEDPRFKSLQNIQILPLSLPIGRKNPFAPISGSN